MFEGQCSLHPVARDPRLLEAAQPPSIGRADFQQPYRINDVRPRNREENSVLPERCGIRFKQVRRYTELCIKCINSLQRPKGRRKLPLTIARVRGASTASYESLSRAAQQLRLVGMSCLDPKHGAVGRSWQEFSP